MIGSRPDGAIAPALAIQQAVKAGSQDEPLARIGPENLSASRPVSRVLYGLRLTTKTWQPFLWDTRCRAPQATYPDDQPRKKGRACALRHPYSVLLPVGFTVPLPLPVARWALTPPFHPYPAASSPAKPACRGRQSGGGAVCFLWHFP